MVRERLERLKTGALEETRKLLWISLYVWVLLSLFSFHKALVLKEQYLLYDQMFALVNAVVLAKVILLGEVVHIGEKLENKPLVPSRIVLEFADASPGDMMVSDQAARSRS